MAVNKTIEGMVERKYFACAVDISKTETPNYVVLGYRIEDSSLELNADVSEGTDINGRSFSSVNKFQPKQTFDAMPITVNGDEAVHGELALKLIDDYRRRKMSSFSNYKAVLIYGFLGEEGAYEADSYSKCTIVPTSIGGADWTELSFEVNFGGDVSFGTVDKLIDEVEFTPEA